MRTLRPFSGRTLLLTLVLTLFGAAACRGETPAESRRRARVEAAVHHVLTLLDAARPIRVSLSPEELAAVRESGTAQAWGGDFLADLEILTVWIADTEAKVRAQQAAYPDKIGGITEVVLAELHSIRDTLRKGHVAKARVAYNRARTGQ